MQHYRIVWSLKNGGRPSSHFMNHSVRVAATDGACRVIYHAHPADVIALATCEKMKDYEAAVWAHHGLFVSGPDFDTTFGLMHTIEKSAQIWVLAHSCGQERQTITDDDLRAIAKEFGVTLREAFLN